MNLLMNMTLICIPIITSSLFFIALKLDEHGRQRASDSVMLAFYFSNAVGVVILMAVVLPHFVLNLIGAGVDGLA